MTSHLIFLLYYSWVTVLFENLPLYACLLLLRWEHLVSFFKETCSLKAPVLWELADGKGNWNPMLGSRDRMYGVIELVSAHCSKELSWIELIAFNTVSNPLKTPCFWYSWTVLIMWMDSYGSLESNLRMNLDITIEAMGIGELPSSSKLLWEDNGKVTTSRSVGRNKCYWEAQCGMKNVSWMWILISAFSCDQAINNPKKNGTVMGCRCICPVPFKYLHC